MRTDWSIGCSTVRDGGGGGVMMKNVPTGPVRLVLVRCASLSCTGPDSAPSAITSRMEKFVAPGGFKGEGSKQKAWVGMAHWRDTSRPSVLCSSMLLPVPGAAQFV